MGKFAAFSHEGTANFGGRQVSVEAKKELRHALFLIYPQFAQHCEFCCAKIDYNVIFSSFFAQQNSHRGLKRDKRISEELFSLCERKKPHRGLKRNPIANF